MNFVRSCRLKIVAGMTTLWNF